MRSLRMQPRPTRDPLLTLGGDCGRGGGSDGQLTGGGKQPAAVACESVLLSYPSLQPRPVYICLVCHTPVPVTPIIPTYPVYYNNCSPFPYKQVHQPGSLAQCPTDPSLCNCTLPCLNPVSLPPVLVTVTPNRSLPCNACRLALIFRSLCPNL